MRRLVAAAALLAVSVPTQVARADTRVTLDGRVVWAGGKVTAKGVSGNGTYVYAEGVPAGRHTMEGTR